MQAALGASTPTVVNPGQVLTGLTATCTNLSATNPAINATCVPSVSVGTISALSCVPASPQASLAANGAIVCTYTYTAPGTQGGTDEAATTVTFTATTGATNDTVPGNNVVTVNATVIDAVSDTVTQPPGAQTFNVGTNDQFPVGSTFTVTPGGTCTATSPNSPATNTTGILSYTVPGSGNCTVNYTVCAPAPNGATCDTAVLTITAIAVNSDMTPVITGLPTIAAPGATVTGQIVCTNAGPAAAINATCVAVGNNGSMVSVTGAGCVASTGTAASLPLGATLICPIQVVMPGTPGGADTPPLNVTVTGTTGATNDSNGGAGAGGNNSTTALITLIDAVDDTDTKPAGAVGVTTNVGGNDQAPPGSSFTVTGGTCAAASPASPATNTTGVLTYNVPASGVCTVNYRVCAPAPDSTQCDTAVLTVTAVVPAVADLAIQKNGPALVAPNGAVIYTLIVSNTGPGAANAATYTDALPTSLTGVTATCGNPVGGASCATPTVAGGLVSGSVPLLPAGGSVTITITGVAPASGALSNVANVTAPLGVTDPDPTNNTSGTVVTRITPNVPLVAGVAIVKSGSTSVVANGAVTYLLTVTNVGPGNANSAILEDRVPNGITAVAAQCLSATGGASCSAPVVTGNVVSATIAAFPANSTVVYRVTGLAPVSGSVVNTATIALPPGLTDPDPSNNTSSITTTVVPSVRTTNLSAIKLGPAQVDPNGIVTYRITLTNSGAADADGATYLDNVPTALTGVTAACSSVTGGAVCGAQAANVAGNRVSGAIATFPAGSSVTITVTGRAPNTPARFVNSVTVTAPPGVVDSDPTDNIGGPVITQVRVAAVEGRVWLDTNHDRRRDPSEALLPGWTVQLLAPNGSGGYTVVGSAVTDATGFYRIGGVAPGSNYRIVFRDPVGGIVFGSPVDGETAATQGLGNGTFNPATSSNATLRGGIIQSIELVEGVTVIEQSLPIDPTGVVYDSQTRLPVAGAQVCVDGPAGFNPAVQLVSGQRCVTTGADGFYQFLFTGIGAGAAPAGNYTLSVVPPSGYSIPSVIAPQPLFAVPGPNNINTLIQPQASAPAVGQSTRYHFQFAFDGSSGGVINNHIPIDPPIGGTLLLNKAAAVSAAEVGDSVQYTLRVRNTGTGPVAGGTLRDTLPAGFRFIPGTLRVNGLAATQPIGVGPRLDITLPTLDGGSTTEVTYFVRIGVGSAEGDGINRAQVYVGATPRSNLAAAKVQIRGGVFGADACIVGKVYIDCNGDHVQSNSGGSNELGIPGVRIVMETGAYAITDSEGKYNICPVSPLTHVLRVDKRTLPIGSRMLPSSNRNAGDGMSLFVDVTKGELARADFIEGSCSAPVLDQVKARRAQGSQPGPETEKPDGATWKNQGSGAPFQPQQILPQPRQSDAKSGEGK